MKKIEKLKPFLDKHNPDTHDVWLLTVDKIDEIIDYINQFDIREGHSFKTGHWTTTYPSTVIPREDEE